MGSKVDMETRHEIVTNNYDIGVRFYYSEDKGSYVTPHWHNSIELIYVFKGKVSFRYKNADHLISDGQFIIINSKEIHSVTGFENQALVLQVPLSYIENYLADLKFYRFDVMGKENEPSYQQICKLFIELNEVYQERKNGYALKYHSNLLNIFYILLNDFSKKIDLEMLDKAEQTENRIKEIVLYINENYDNKIVVSELAKKFFYNPDYLSRVFKKTMGVTLIEYVYQVRLSYVYQDLLHTTLSIKDIFSKHGCTNYRLSLKLFKELYRKTPQAVRLQTKSE